MTLFFHEIRKNRIALLIWTFAIAFMLGVTIVIFPEMEKEMGEMENLMSNMGAFSDAFGMNKINFSEFIGYFGIECGNVLGLGGALFAATAGAMALSSEEANHTAEFLLSHPIKREKVIGLKLLSVISQITILNLVVLGIVMGLTAAIITKPPYNTMLLIFAAYYVMQLIIAFICFGISAFLKNGAIGIGIGVGFLFYIVNIISNLTEDLEFLKHLTPFSFADSSEIIQNNSLPTKYLALVVVMAILGVVLAFVKYTKKDIA